MAQNPSSSDQQILQVLSTKSDDGGFVPSSVDNDFRETAGGKSMKSSDDNEDPSRLAVLRLPQCILLKGDNGKYLRTVTSGANEFAADNKMDGTVYEVVNLSDGAVGIRSSFNNRFLGNFNYSIIAIFEAHHLELSDDTRFWAVKMGRGTHTNLIGLRLFQRWPDMQLRCLRHFGRQQLEVDVVPMTGKAACFEVEEAVSQRQIYGVQYHMADARIYDHEPLTSVTKDVKNWSATPQKGVLSFSHTESESQTWGSTDSWKISGSVGISVRVPFLAKASITTEAYYSGAYEWGEALETAKEIASKLEVEIPPKSMVQATMIVQKGKLEVPFSYGQTDATFDGRTVSSNLPDGLYTGVNTYVTFHTIKKSL